MTVISLHDTVDMLESVHRKVASNEDLRDALRLRRRPLRRRHRVLIRLTTPMSKLASDWWMAERILHENGRRTAASDISDRRRVYIGDLRDANERVDSALADPTLRVELIAALVNDAASDSDLETNLHLKHTIIRALAQVEPSVARRALQQRISDTSKRSTLNRWMKGR